MAQSVGSKLPVFLFVTCVFSALECRLECALGYMPNKNGLVTCVEGSFVPYKTSEFRCEESVALLVSKTGQVELFTSKKECKMSLPISPELAHSGAKMAVIDNQIIVMSTELVLGSKRFMKIHKPSILAMQYSIEKTIFTSKEAPTILASSNTILIGGTSKTMKFNKNVWTQVTPMYESGSIFYIPEKTCVIKTSMDTFTILGGRIYKDDKEEISEQIIEYNIKNSIATIVASLNQERYDHSCSIKDQVIRIAGGKSESEDLVDEKYNIQTRTSISMTASASLNRSEHILVKTGEEIWALGGISSDGANQPTIMKLNGEFWEPHTEQQLLSHNTSNLMFASLPMSMVDCTEGCACGVANASATNSNARIYNGNEASVSRASDLTSF